MRTRRLLIGLAILSLLLPSVGATDQYRGDAERSSFARLADGPIDVVARFQLPDGFQTNYPIGAPGVATPRGVAIFLSSADECAIALIPDPRFAEWTLHRIDGCRGVQGGRILAYDSVTDSFFLCVEGHVGSPVLRALRIPTNELVWQLAPAAFGIPGMSQYSCLGGAFDPTAREIVVPFVGFGSAGLARDNRLAAIDADTGSLLWHTPIMLRSTAANSLVDVTTTPTVFPRAVTLTETGVVLMSVLQHTPLSGPFAALASLYDRQGNLQRTIDAREVAADPASSMATMASNYAVADGTLATLALGGNVMVVNPQNGETVQSSPIRAADPSSNYIWWTPGGLTQERAIVALPHSISAFEASNLELAWTFGDGAEWDVNEILLSTRGEILAFEAHIQDGRAQVVMLDTRTGRFLGSLPIAPADDETSLWHVVAVEGEGVATFDTFGHFVFLGQASEELLPRITVSDEFPPVSGPIEMTVQPPLGTSITQLTVNWGDGTIEAVEPGTTLRHAYATPGFVTHRVTAVYADGRTATALGTVQVGGTPPPELSTLQKAFSPEWQEWTFFGLGLTITIIGFAFTVGRQRHRLNRLERELAAVEEIRLLSVDNPREAARNLKGYRERLPVDLAKRRIDESQFHVLDVRSARLLKVLRTRLFTPYDTRLSARYHRLLDAAFEDAILQVSEKEALLVQLDMEEALSARDKQEIAAILDDFTSYNVGLILR